MSDKTEPVKWLVTVLLSALMGGAVYIGWIRDEAILLDIAGAIAACF